MSLAREVAEAYISVHGDMSPFRKDLEKLTADAAKEAQRSADSFADGWNKRVSEKTKGQWEALQDGFFSGKSFDWDRAIGKFDSTNLDEARVKMQEFLYEMEREGKIGDKNSDTYKKLADSIDDVVNKKIALRDATKAQADEEQREADHARSIGQAFTEAMAENEKFNRSFDGMIKNMHKADMESDFKRLAEAVKDVDFSKFAKNFDSFTELRKRVIDVTDAMKEQGRITQESSDIARAGVENYIRDEQSRMRAIQDSLDATRRAREETDKYKKSLDGMVEGAKIQKLEQDFQNLSRAIASNDFSNIAKGHQDMDSLRARTDEVLYSMQALGRIGPNEIDKARRAMASANIEFKKVDDAERSFEGLRNTISRVSSGLQSAWNVSKGFREHLGGFAGLNVFGDLINEGLDFIHNLDRIAVSASIATTKLATMASIGGTGLASLVVIAKDVADSLAGVSALLPAFATGAAIMAFIAVEALGGITKKYKTQIAQFKLDLVAEVNKGFDPAMDNFEKVTLPTLRKGLSDTAAAMGRLFGTIVDSITKSNTNDAIANMFKRMNDAMDKSQVGVSALVDAWSVLGQVGSKYFDRFAEGFNKMSTKFDEFIKKSAENGNLDKWINNGIEGMKDLGRALDGAFGIFNAIDSAARTAGVGGLKVFADRLQGAAKAMQDIAFQRTLTTYLLGMKDVTDKVFTAIGKLGPALTSLAPTVQIALGHVGEAISTVIGYVGQIFDNPKFQKGLRDFTGGIETAIAHLAPAIKPFGDAIGQTLSLLSEVLVSVSDIVTAMTVNWHPIFTDMSKKLETLIQPLRDGLVQAIKDLTPALQSIDDNIVTPLVAFIKDKLIPALTGKDGIIENAAKLIELLAPIIGKFITEVLPPLVDLLIAILPEIVILVGLLTPVVVQVIEDLGKFLGVLAGAMKEFNKWAKPSIDFFERLGTLFTTAKLPDFGSFVDNLSVRFSLALGKTNFGKVFGKWVEDQTQPIQDEITKITKIVTDVFDPEKMVLDVAKKLAGIDWDKVATQFWAGLPISLALFGLKTIEDIKKDLDNWWAGVRGMFQDWFKSTFGFGGKESTFGGATIGGKGMGAGAKLGPEIFDKEAETSWFDDLFKGIGKQWDDFWSGVNDTVTTWGSTVKTGWDGFWSGVGTKVSDTATEMGTNIGNFTADTQTNLSNFGTDVSTNWNTFWGDVGTTLSTKWGEFTSTVSTKAGEIGTNVQSFGGQVQTNWNSFWGTVGQTLSTKWQEFSGTVSGKAGEIQGKVSGMGTSVQGNWSGIWGAVGSILSSKWQEFYNTVTSKGDEISGWVGGLPDRISSAFGSGWGVLTNAGSAIMGSLLGGLESAYGEVQKFIGRIAGWIAENKGPISYDKTLLVPAGEAIMYGLHSSMQDKFADVMDLVSSMAGSIASAFKDSEMYAKGKDAAKGLADGLIAGKIDVAAAYANLGDLPAITANVGQIGTLNTSTSAGTSGAVAGPGGTVVAPGAIQITTPTSDPALVASMVIDGLTSYSKF